MKRMSSRRRETYRVREIIYCCAILALVFSVPSSRIHGQSPGVAEKPYLGWSSFSEQTLSSNFLTQTNIQAQSDALEASGLQSHGFTYINIDSGWQGSYDANGRPLPNTSLFPDMATLIAHIHSNGQKVGISWTPGVAREALAANSQILDTNYPLKDILAVPYTAGNNLTSTATNGSSAGASTQNTSFLTSTRCITTTNCVASGGGASLPNYKIDFTKSGSQEYIDSIVALFASWGVDFLRLDGVSPSASNSSIDNQPDVAAWGKAIAKSGRPIWLTISSALDQDYLNTWQQYSNARRIDNDIECEGSCSTITNWALTSQRLYDLVSWENEAGPQLGWNDLGPLEVGSTAISGLNPVEQQSAVTFWAMANAPMYLGGDLNALDSETKQLLTNDEVLAVDQSGHPASQVAGGMTPIWASDLGDGTFYIALFNLNAFPSPVRIKWGTLGFIDARDVRDLWNHTDLGSSDQAFTATVLGHGVRLLKVTTKGTADRELLQNYEAEFALIHGQTMFSTCKTCSGANKVTKLGLGAENTITFNNVYAERAGTYRMQINPAANGPRGLFFQINDNDSYSLKVGGGSVNQPSTTIVPVKLQAGYNTVQFGNPANLAPDLDRIAIIGDSFVQSPGSTAYEAEVAQLSGTEFTSYCQLCSGGSKVASIDQSDENAVTFPNVSVITGGEYEMEVDYLTSGQHSLFMTVNNGKEIELDLSGSSISLPTSTVVPVLLKAGKNTIRFQSHEIEAPALDRIAIAPTIEPVNLTTSIVAQTGPQSERVWKLDIANYGDQPAHGAQINILSLTQARGKGTCQPKVLAALPLNIGTIPKHDHATVPVRLDFSNCSEDSRFNAAIVFSSDNGAVVGDTVGTDIPR